MITQFEHQYNLGQIQELNKMLLRKDLGEVSRKMLLDSLREFHKKRKEYEDALPPCDCGSCE